MKVLKMLVSLSKRIFDKLSSPAHTVRRGAVLQFVGASHFLYTVH